MERASYQTRLQRSLSSEKRLSGSKTKLTSKSPAKKNNWADESNDSKLINSSITKLDSTVDRERPKIPNGKKNLNQSSVVERTNNFISELKG